MTMSIIYDTLAREGIYQRYRNGAKVQPEDVETLKKLAVSNRIVFYLLNGELYAESPYI